MEFSKKSQVFETLISAIFLLELLRPNVAEFRAVGLATSTITFRALNCRKHSAVLTDFGGIGDGKTSNTKAFEAAIMNLSQVAPDGGAQLIVPPGKWLTGSFNLTSHFTLFVHKDAVILGSQDESEWPPVALLPSYGRGRDAPSGRLSSLIFGTNLTDVVITGNPNTHLASQAFNQVGGLSIWLVIQGNNGTIDGQGSYWWKLFRDNKMTVTRPYMIEIMYSKQVQISNLTLVNSPSWNVHPIYSSDIIIQHLTVFAPVDSPNTDGIDPDSCTNTRIEDSFIVSGDDCIAVKSGWDEYGIKFNMPTKQLVIRRFACISPSSATIALGSEMSGGIEDVRVEDVTAINTESGVRIKTGVGRGAYVKDVYVRNMTLNTMKYVFWMTGDYGSHPDAEFDQNAFPVIKGINYRDIVADNVTQSAQLDGIGKHPFTDICISNVNIKLAAKPKGVQWNCSDVQGVTNRVSPEPCNLLPRKEIDCPFAKDRLPIEDVQLKTCSISGNF